MSSSLHTSQQHQQPQGPINYASTEYGATIADVSHESPHVASSASNVLNAREDLLWIGGQVPQYITVRLGSVSHYPGVRFIGWHVWHDYLTNPKTVEVSSGPAQMSQEPVMVCTALAGAGIQLWELPAPIPPTHRYVTFRITSTFGGSTTYMNRLFLFTQHPGPSFSSPGGDNEESVMQATSMGSAAEDLSKHQQQHQQQQQQQQQSTTLRSPARVSHHDDAMAAAAQAHNQSTGSFGNSPPLVSTLLKELDDDIRMLHPIKHVSPQRNLLLAGEMNVPHQEQQQQFDTSSPTTGVPFPGQQQQHGVMTGSSVTADAAASDGSAALSLRLDAMERRFEALQRGMEAQQRDVRLLVQTITAQQQQQQEEHHASSRRKGKDAGRTTGGSKSNSKPEDDDAAPVAFPKDALREYVEDVLAPKLAKHSRRTEARILQHLDEQVHSILREVSTAVDERVKQHLHRMSQDIEHFHHGAAPPLMRATAAAAGGSTKKKQTRGNHAADVSRDVYDEMGDVSIVDAYARRKRH